jgi:D-amino-acid dehydrogenase
VGLSRLSLELYRDLEARGGTELGLRDGPLLETFSSEGWRGEAQPKEEELGRLGFAARIVEGDELFALEPALAPSTLGALVIEDQPSGDCHASVRAIGAGLAHRGARIFEHTAVHRILVQDGRVTGVLAGDPRERIPADVVVLAAGAWSRSVAGSIGFRLPMQPATGYSSTMPAWEGAPRLPLIASETRVVVLPLGDRVRFAGTLELAGFRRGPDPVRYRAVVRSGAAALREPPLTEGDPWFGFRPLMPDGLPAIGWAPGVEGALVATGHGTLGFTQASATGRLIAELATGRPTSVPTEPFRPDRF